MGGRRSRTRAGKEQGESGERRCIRCRGEGGQLRKKRAHLKDEEDVDRGTDSDFHRMSATRRRGGARGHTHTCMPLMRTLRRGVSLSSAQKLKAGHGYDNGAHHSSSLLSSQHPKSAFRRTLSTRSALRPACHTRAYTVSSEHVPPKHLHTTTKRRFPRKFHHNHI